MSVEILQFSPTKSTDMQNKVVRDFGIVKREMVAIEREVKNMKQWFTFDTADEFIKSFIDTRKKMDAVFEESAKFLNSRVEEAKLAYELIGKSVTIT